MSDLTPPGRDDVWGPMKQFVLPRVSTVHDLIARQVTYLGERVLVDNDPGFEYWCVQMTPNLHWERRKVQPADNSPGNPA